MTNNKTRNNKSIKTDNPQIKQVEKSKIFINLPSNLVTKLQKKIDIHDI